MSDTHSQDDRKPAAVEYREPRDFEKGKGGGGGGGVKLPPSATTQSKRARSSSSRHKRSQKHSHKHKQHHHVKSSQNNRTTNDGDDEKITAGDAPETAMDNKHIRSHKHSHKHSDKQKRHHHARAPTTDKKWTASSSLAGITESEKPSYKYSNEEGYKKDIDEDKIVKSLEPLTYAPSLMAHVYRHDVAVTNSRNEIEKEKAVVDGSIRNNRASIGFETGMEATMEPFAAISAHQEDQLIDNKLEEGTFGANFEPDFGHDGTNNIPGASIPITPPPPQQNQPGAIRVGGIDEENADDDNDSMTNMTIQNSPVDPNNLVLAEVVDEDEENRKFQEQLEHKIAERERQRAEQEGAIPEAEIVIEKQNCTTRVKIWSGIAVVLAMTVVVVLGTVLTQKQNAPTFTPSPQEILKELESLLISVSFDNGTALQNQSTPQNNALNWLANNNTNLDTYLNVTKIQRYALATLFYSTNGISWDRKDEWMSNSNECLWYNNGLSVCTNGSVETLSLELNNLIGTIPNELALLSNLSWLSLSDNSLTGTIPTDIALLSNLSWLDLSSNSLMGTIPNQLGLLTKLTWLEIYSNSLTGTIPSQIALLSNLNTLDLSSNSLTGTIPTEIALLSNLYELWLSDNRLTGTIPTEIALLSNLSDVILSGNSLTGTIPSQLAMMPNLYTLALSGNNFTGEFTCPARAFIDECYISCDDYNNDTCRSL